MRLGKYDDLAKNTALFTLSNLGTKLISFLLVPLYTYTLSTTEYGTTDLITTTVSLLIPIITFNIQDAVLRFSFDNENKPEQIISIALKIILLGTCILGCILLCLKNILFKTIEAKYILFLFISFVSTAMYNSIHMYLKAVNKINVIVISSLLTTILNCTLNIYFLVITKFGINGYLLANVISSCSGLLYCLHKINIVQITQNRFNIRIAKKMLIYSIPLVFNSLAWWINNASDRYILTFFKGASENGVYSAAYKIPTILSTVQSIFYNAWSISAIKEFDKNDTDGFIGNIYTIYSNLSILACSILVLFNYPIAKILYGNDFFSAWRFVPFLLTGTLFNGLGLFLGCLYVATRKTSSVSKTTLIGASINTIFNLILIPHIGALGASIATFLGYFVVWYIRVIDIKKMIKMKVQWGKQIASLALLISQTIVATQNSFIIQILIFLVLCLIQKETMLSFTRKIRSNLSRIERYHATNKRT